MMELSPRLKKIADLIPRGSVVADIGTDHAYIPVYCFQNGISERAIAMDVNEGPLSRAEANLEKYGFADKAELRLSDGLQKLSPGEADVIVIAGMGGLLIMDILKNGSDVVSDDTLMLIQPMIAPIELREYLFSSGFDIVDEYVEREENKFYNIFCVRRGKAIVNDQNLIIGRNLAKNSPENVVDYLEYKISVCEKIVSGIKKSENPDTRLIDKYSHEKSVYQSYKEVIISDNSI